MSALSASSLRSPSANLRAFSRRTSSKSRSRASARRASSAPTSLSRRRRWASSSLSRWARASSSRLAAPFWMAPLMPSSSPMASASLGRVSSMRQAARRASMARSTGLSTGMPVASPGTGWPSWSKRERRQRSSMISCRLRLRRGLSPVCRAMACVRALRRGFSRAGTSPPPPCSRRAGAGVPVALAAGALRGASDLAGASGLGASASSGASALLGASASVAGAGACAPSSSDAPGAASSMQVSSAPKPGRRVSLPASAFTRASSRESSTAPSTPSMAATRHSAGATPPFSPRKSTRAVPGRGMVRAIWLESSGAARSSTS